MRRSAKNAASAAIRLVSATLLLTAVAATESGAVEPDEILEDAALEARAREISGELRCLVCRNESIDESGASLARDLRLLVRERLVAGDTDREVLDYVVERYGEYVLLRPPPSGSSWILWASGPLALVLALALAANFVRARAAAMESEPDGGTDDDLDDDPDDHLDTPGDRDAV